MSEVGYEWVRTRKTPVGGSKTVRRIYDPVNFPAITRICRAHTRDQLTQARAKPSTQAHTRSINARSRDTRAIYKHVALSRSVALRFDRMNLSSDTNRSDGACDTNPTGCGC